jgi:GrpB-like predicted nucleotidyltransferase (UPF0157 family)
MHGEGVQIADYDPKWPQLFEELRQRILFSMGAIVISVEHVGSTSVPDLAAKPIIDLDVVVRPQDVPAAIAALQQLGYRHEGDLGVAGREAFRWTARGPEHHLYVCPEGSPAFRRHIALRDYLRTHPDDAREYEQLKRRLALEYCDDRTRYQNSKAAFVESLAKKAEAHAQKKAKQ